MNKKILLAVGCSALLFSATGCGNAHTNVSKNDDWYLKLNDDKVTKEDLYKEVIGQDNLTPITSEMDYVLANKVVKTDDKMKKDAQKQLDAIKKQTGKQFDTILKQSGYSEKELLDRAFITQIKLQKLCDKYINEKFDDLNKKYQPLKAQVFMLKDKKDKSRVEKALKDKSDFTKICEKYGVKEAFSFDEQVYLNTNGVPESVWKEALKIKKDNQTTDLIYDKTSKNYFAVKVIKSNPKDFKDELIKKYNELAQPKQQTQQSTTQTNPTDSESDLYKKAYNYYLNKYNYSVHDIDIYKNLLKLSKEKYEEK